MIKSHKWLEIICFFILWNSKTIPQSCPYSFIQFGIFLRHEKVKGKMQSISVQSHFPVLAYSIALFKIGSLSSIKSFIVY